MGKKEGFEIIQKWLLGALFNEFGPLYYRKILNSQKKWSDIYEKSHGSSMQESQVISVRRRQTHQRPLKVSGKCTRRLGWGSRSAQPLDYEVSNHMMISPLLLKQKADFYWF